MGLHQVTVSSKGGKRFCIRNNVSKIHIMNYQVRQSLILNVVRKLIIKVIVNKIVKSRCYKSMLSQTPSSV